MSPVSKRILYWAPRALCIAFALFLSLFALDVFNEVHGFFHIVLALLIHLVPTWIVLAILVVSWRWEWVGAVLYTAAGAFYAHFALLRHHPDWILPIAVPVWVVAALFLWNWLKRRELHAPRTA